MFNIGAGRELQFVWVSDDKIVGTWKKSPDDYDHYEYVVIDAITGKGHVLPFDTGYYLGFDFFPGGGDSPEKFPLDPISSSMIKYRCLGMQCFKT